MIRNGGEGMTLAYVFPGQGSQAIGMLGDFGDAQPIVRATFAEASAALGYDLWQVCQSGPSERLSKTEVPQPALLTAGVAIYRLWQEMGGDEAAMMSGHSLGEYTALVCAGAIDFVSAVKLVEFRGQSMQAAVPDGTGSMAAILGLDDEKVIEACHAVAGDDIVAAVNFNSPGQVVIAGHRAAVDRAIDEAKKMGARKAISLPVSVPSHCALMKDAATRLAKKLEETEISPANVAVVQNVDAQVCDSADAMRDALVRQLYLPVRWVGCVQYMVGNGVDTFLEFGPGKVLAGLSRRIDRGMGMHPVYDVASLQAALEKTAGNGND